jgi:hypothetical protein
MKKLRSLCTAHAARDEAASQFSWSGPESWLFFLFNDMLVGARVMTQVTHRARLKWAQPCHTLSMYRMSKFGVFLKFSIHHHARVDQGTVPSTPCPLKRGVRGRGRFPPKGKGGPENVFDGLSDTRPPGRAILETCLTFSRHGAPSQTHARASANL